MEDKIIILGANGTTKVLLDILDENNNIQYNIILLDDDVHKHNKHFCGNLVSGSIQYLKNYTLNNSTVIVAIGSTGNLENRIKIIEYAKNLGFYQQVVVDKSAIVSDNCELGYGVAVLPGVIINSNSYIGNHVLLNTGSIIEHDCKIGDYSFISPNVTLCGNVVVGKKTFIGAGTTIVGGINVGDNVTIGAGSVVVKDVPDNTILYGNPAHNSAREK